MPLPLIHRWLTLVALALTVALFSVGVAPSLPAAADERVPPTATFRGEFKVDPPLSGAFEAVQLVVDFPDGARVGRHTHGGPGYITMIENELTMSIGADPVRTYAEGESFVEPYRIIAEGANLTAVPSSVLVTYLLPIGAPVTTLEPSGGSAAPAAAPAGPLPPGSSPRFESRMRIEDASSIQMVSQALRNYEPGAQTRSVIPMGTMALLTVMEGEVTVFTGAGQRTYRVGEHWTEVVGEGTLSANQGSTPAVAAISVLHLN